MSKVMKIWFITASILIFCGLIVFTAQMTVYDWDFSRLAEEDYETNTNIISESFLDIKVNTEYADITVVPATDGECKVVCFEERKAKHIVCVENGTLKITLSDEKCWYDYFGFNFADTKITVYLPEAEYGALSVNTSSGDVVAHGITLGALDATTASGKVRLSSIKCEGDLKLNLLSGNSWMNGVTCKNLVIGSSCGDVEMTSVSTAEMIKITSTSGDVELNSAVALGKLQIYSKSGDVELKVCDASEIFIETLSGDVEGSILSDKVFIARSSTGLVEVPKTVSGGRCEIVSKSGNIYIKLSRNPYNK